MPAFNEGSAIVRVIDTVLQELRGCGVEDAEIVVVDDGSRDNTRDVMRALCLDQPHVRYLRLSRNFGKEIALTAGLQHARGSAVILMDSDGQHPVELFKTFLARWREGYDVVFATQGHRDEPPLQRLLKRSYYGLMDASSKIHIPANAGDFRLLDRKVVDVLNALPERNRYMKGLYAWVGFKSCGVEFEHGERLAGQSHYNWHRLFSLALTGLTAFTVTPLRLISIAGALVSLAAFLYGLYVVFEHFYGSHQPSGYATLVVGMMVLSGIQLLSLGAIGEYLGRVFEEVKQRPLYVVAEDSAADERTAQTLHQAPSP